MPVSRRQSLYYSPQKRSEIQQARKKKLYVKINGTKMTLSKIDSSQGEHTINKSARIVPGSFNFEFDKELLNKCL